MPGLLLVEEVLEGAPAEGGVDPGTGVADPGRPAGCANPGGRIAAFGMPVAAGIRSPAGLDPAVAGLGSTTEDVCACPVAGGSAAGGMFCCGEPLSEDIRAWEAVAEGLSGVGRGFA